MAKQIVVTESSYQKLKEELDYLKNVKRKEAAENVGIARSFGDLSENSEYDEAKNEQAKIEAQISELEETISHAKVISDHEIQTDMVNVGISVTVYDMDYDEEVEYQIVSSREVDPLENKISDQSPIGKALLEAEKELIRVGDETGMEIVIVRPPLIYGPDCQNLFGEVKIMVDYCVPLPLRSCKRNHRSLVGIDNLVDFLICCATHPDAANETFLVSDGEDLSTLNIFKLLAKTHHRPCLLWPFPPILVRLFNSYIGRQAWEEFFFQSQVADIHKAQLVLGWTPPLSVEQSFRRSWDENFYLGSHTSSK